MKTIQEVDQRFIELQILMNEITKTKAYIAWYYPAEQEQVHQDYEKYTKEWDDLVIYRLKFLE